MSNQTSKFPFKPYHIAMSPAIDAIAVSRHTATQASGQLQFAGTMIQMAILPHEAEVTRESFTKKLNEIAVHRPSIRSEAWVPKTFEALKQQALLHANGAKSPPMQQQSPPLADNQPQQMRQQ